MKIEDITVELHAVDRVTPVIRRIRWNLWIWRYADRIILGLGAALMSVSIVLAFILGRVTA